MKKYLIPFLCYTLIPLILNPFLSEVITYTIRTIVLAGLLIYFYKQYNLKFRFSLLSFLVGILFFLVWLVLAPILPIGLSVYAPASMYAIIIKLLGFILIAPFIEELFVRDFLIRVCQGGRQWHLIQIGNFCWPSFIISVLFFGFSHSLWLAGLVTGVGFNLLLYKTKRMDTCIQAHMIVNFISAIYVLYTGQWMLW
ncbi:MAG: CAAX prenyl protease-related protein [Nanoarchaeota archaeon]|nr:CAAX prenyl protease-related protein [Nanoarchaeota archaeon]